MSLHNIHDKSSHILIATHNSWTMFYHYNQKVAHIALWDIIIHIYYNYRAAYMCTIIGHTFIIEDSLSRTLPCSKQAITIM